MEGIGAIVPDEQEYLSYEDRSPEGRFMHISWLPDSAVTITSCLPSGFGLS
jgi:hypothetical protein